MSVERQETFAMAAEEAGQWHAQAFRIALVAAAGFTLGHLFGWDFPFLPSLIAVQLLSAGRSIDIKRAIGFVALMAIGCGVSLFISLALVDRPLDLVVVIGLLVFLEFLAVATGKAAAGIFLITTSFVPLMALSSTDLANALVHDLILGSVLALLLIFLIHALLPGRPAAQQATPKVVQESSPVVVALANTAVLMSLFVYFMGAGTPTSIIVIMVTAITILQQSAATRGSSAAFGLIMGNIAGGVAASVAYLLVSLLPIPVFLFLVVLLFGLIFAGHIVAGGKMASVYSVGAATFLTVLGLGLSPLPQDSSAIFVSRVSTVIVASLYTIGMASVLRSVFLKHHLRGSVAPELHG
jgi:hypothetical protein